MTANTITSRKQRLGVGDDILRFHTVAALTAAADKWAWLITRNCYIIDVIIVSKTAGSGGVSDIADVNINGTTIYTTQANRPTLLVGDTGLWTEAAEPEVVSLVTGDVVSVDIDQVCTTGSAKVSFSIILGIAR